MNPELDSYFTNAKKWPKELAALRKIILNCGLTETLKWRGPCYTYDNTNVIIIGELKDSCVLSFLKGVLLQDAEKLLSKPGENSQSAKIIKFTTVEDIKAIEATIKAYIYEAIEIEKAGLKVKRLDPNEIIFTKTLQIKIKKDATFKKAFEALTPGRQRAYNMFFEAAKQIKTQEERIEKYTKRILDGKGINDCICGLSKKMPQCDGSHKYL